MSTNTTLEKVGKWGSGGTPLSSTPDFYNGDIPWLIIEDLNDHFVTRSEKSITELGLKNSSAKLVPPNTLLVAMYGSIGKLGINKIPVAMNQAIAYCKPHTDIADLRYLFFFLLHARKTLTGEGRGGTQQNISQEILKTYPINLPKPEEQKRIAAILDKADRLRRQRRFAQTLSDSFLQSVFIKMFGDPVANAMNWKMRTVGDELDVMQYGPRFYNELYSPTGVRIIRITDLDSSGELDFLSMPRLKVSDEDIETYALKPGELIFARSGATVGKTALIPEKAPVCIAGAYFMTMRFKKAINPVFVRHLFAAKPIQSIIESRSRQSAQQNFSGPGLRELPLVVPPLPIQEKFATIVQKFERIRRQQREATRQAEHLFQTLLHRAFRGELVRHDPNDELAREHINRVGKE